jgi:carbamate kinase
MTSRTANQESEREAPRAGGDRVAVVAFGGNALIRQGQEGYVEEQIQNAEAAIAPLGALLAAGYRLVLVHGNGPQVGNELIRQEEAATKLPPLTLDLCVANTQGSMGYLLERAYRKASPIHAPWPELVSILTMVEVDGDDPAFQNPTKPVGPFLTRYRARQVRREGGKSVVEDAGRGYRVVVPSPKPLRLVGLSAIRTLLEAGFSVIAGGGGGIPVSKSPGPGLRGLEAVIDKDHTASLIGRELSAELLVILTAVPKVSIFFNKPEQRALDEVTAEEMRKYLAAGHFPPGSMGPKVQAAIHFVEGGGREAIVTSADRLHDAILGRDGTRIRV